MTPEKCHLCGRLLDKPTDPLSKNCGGDCLGCIQEVEGINPTNYTPHTTHYEHQAKAFAASADAPLFSLEFEPRCGKSKVIIDTCAYNWEKYQSDDATGITACVIIAMPGRVHRNWASDEFPTHWPPRHALRTLVWEAGRSKTKGFQRSLEELLTFKGFSSLLINGESIITEDCRRYLGRFLKARRRVLAALDEFTLICKTPGIRRTKVIHSLSRQPQVVLKRLLDGTPMGDGSPLDLFAPFAFLDPTILGPTSYTAYKHYYASWVKKHNHTQGRDYEELARAPDGTPLYLNMDELRTRRAPYVSRVLRADCFDMPQKVYTKHTFQLTPLQRRTYDALRDEFRAEIQGGEVSARHVLTRYLRLQQCSSNYWPEERIGVICPQCEGNGCASCDDLGIIEGKSPLRVIDPDCNPRIDALREILSLNPVPTLVWARFHEDIDQVMRLATELGLRPVQYDGRIKPAQKDANKTAFQSGESDLVVGHQRSGGRGISFSRARLIVYYSNEFSLLARIQSEDRAELIGKHDATDVVDLIAEDTIDDQVIVPALRSKRAITDYVMGERSGQWL